MKERPILFNGAMVRALLSGQKTQTRRIVKPQPDFAVTGTIGERGVCARFTPDDERLGRLGESIACPYGRLGDRLLVRETARCDYRGETPPEGNGAIGVTYKAGGPGKMQHYSLASRDLYPWFPNISHNADNSMRWAPAIHMPRWASRITLEIVSVRVERLQDISEADARAEGIVDGGCTECGNSEPCGCANPSPDARDAYCHLWGQINGVDAWAANPWVWVVEFRRLP